MSIHHLLSCRCSSISHFEAIAVDLTKTNRTDLCHQQRPSLGVAKDKDVEGEEEGEAITHVSKEAKVKMMSKKDRKDKKMLSSKDDKHFLLTGEKLAERPGCHKKEKCEKPDKALCFWESVTMTTMRHISPAKKTDGRETSQARDHGAAPNGRSPSRSPACAKVRWTSRAKVRLAGMGRLPRKSLSDAAWQGLD
ncbi:uncharacterized protein si:ch211-225h24.2 isoform X1 [Syngnathus typhle]|uniref:uncharacterized protein si:ch211-225h24.2 isoform X1 n=1 Tax=Syngnathus typhle TaxID=161592 RepID=UPI002A699C71|nr:uncharacterized protein si:ch211-225h24.2 isoform X1 [Syngnathus typhle]